MNLRPVSEHQPLADRGRRASGRLVFGAASFSLGERASEASMRVPGESDPAGRGERSTDTGGRAERGRGSHTSDHPRDWEHSQGGARKNGQLHGWL